MQFYFRYLIFLILQIFSNYSSNLFNGILMCTVLKCFILFFKNGCMKTCHHCLVISRKTQIYCFLLIYYIKCHKISQKITLFMEIFTFEPQLLYKLCCFVWLGFGVRAFFFTCLFVLNIQLDFT